jgi:hypothetical protein
MSKYQNHSENIASYLDGDMSPDQMQHFEMQLHTDPVLRSEFELQQDIIHTLQDFRKTQLKSRLDQVPVSMGPSGLMGIKAAAAMVISGIIGFGTYLYFITPSEEHSSLTETTITVDQAKSQEEVITEAPNEVVEASELIEESEAESQETETTAPVAINKSSSDLLTISTKDDISKETIETPSPVINSPTLINPEMDEINIEESIELPNAALAQEGLIDNNVVEVETAKRDSDMFHYQYYSSKLYLYGDFRDNPYEILELNSANGKRLFIYYNSIYYRIMDNQQEITPLEELTNRDIIKKLEIIQANK